MTKTDKEKYCRVPTSERQQGCRSNSHQQPGWATTLLNQWGPRNWNGHQHQRLQTPDSPCISACTTATNLSSLGDFQSNTTLLNYSNHQQHHHQHNNNNNNRRMQENLRRTIPEIEQFEPLKKKEVDAEQGVVISEKPKQKVDIKTQLLTAIVVSWVSMIIGYCSAYTSPTAKTLQADLNVDDDKFSWITSLMPLGALAGGFLGGPLIEIIGRKWTILVTDLMFLVAFTVNFFAQDYIYMYVSRVVAGTSVGILSLTLPVYLAETIQPEVRGTLGLLPTAFGNIGILLCYLFGTFYDWKALALIGIILSIPFVIVCWVIRETPRFLISKGKEDETHEALQWLRGPGTNINDEFLELKKSQRENDEEATTCCTLFSKDYAKLIFIALGLMFFQQMSGINAVIFYTAKIFSQSGANLDEGISTTIVGCVNFISTFIAAVLVDRFGRKLLLYISSVSMLISLTALGTYFFLKDAMKYDVSSAGFVPLMSFVVYVLGFSLGFGPVPWLMMGEILPAKIRGAAASLATAFNWTCTFIVTKVFLLLAEAIGFHSTFWVFAGIVLVGLIFTIVCVPETRGQSLADIERKLAGLDVRRTSSVANLKPMPSSF